MTMTLVARRLACATVAALLIVVTSAHGAALVSARPESVGLSTERLARLEAAMQAEIDAAAKPASSR